MVHPKPGTSAFVSEAVCAHAWPRRATSAILCSVLRCCSVFMLSGRGKPYHPREASESMFFPALLFWLFFFLSQGSFLCFSLRKQKSRAVFPSRSHDEITICRKKQSPPSVHILIIVYKLFSVFLSIFFHRFQFLQLGFWNIFPKPWKNGI